MKFFLPLLLLIGLMNGTYCNAITTIEKVTCSGQPFEREKREPMFNDSLIHTKSDCETDCYYYVIAKSGLNYRETPGGKILGKFPMHTRLKVIKRTGILEEIIDGKETFMGEWVGVEKGKDTVYVFNGFLSDIMAWSEMRLYEALAYSKTSYFSHGGFLNLNDLNDLYYDEDGPKLLSEKQLQLSKGIITFNQKEKNNVFKKLRLSNSDTLYIINLNKDAIYKFSLASLSPIAYIDTSIASEHATEHDYLIGLNLEKKYTAEGENFAFIGKTNPFQTGKIKPLIWNRTVNTNFPIKDKIVEDHIILETYKFSLSNYVYFLQAHNILSGEYMNPKRYHVVVINTISNSIVFEDNYFGGECSSLRTIETTDEKIEYNRSWTGAVFKNKAPIIYGIYGDTCGCPRTYSIDKSEPQIVLLCGADL